MKIVFQSDFVTLFNGDCREFDGTADAVISDPPYGMDWDADTMRFTGGRIKRGKNRASPVRSVHGDKTPFDPAPWLRFPRVVLWGVNHFAARVPVGTTLVWIKRADHLFGSFLSDAELAWMKGGHGVYCFRKQFPPPIRAIESGGDPCNPVGVHPCQKPLGLMAWCMDRAKVAPGATVLDPYAGSGSTLIAALNTGRKAVGIEIDEAHCATAARRLREWHAKNGLFLSTANTVLADDAH